MKGAVRRGRRGRALMIDRRVGLLDEITFTGGVANNPGMIAALEEAIKKKVNVSSESHYMGALGAALFAMDTLHAVETPVHQEA